MVVRGLEMVGLLTQVIQDRLMGKAMGQEGRHHTLIQIINTLWEKEVQVYFS